MPSRKKAPAIYQLKITLKGIRPPIWRRVLVESNITLARLHWVIQLSMGWTNSHLHSFTINGVEYGVPMPEYSFGEPDVRNEVTVLLNRSVRKEKFKFDYLYDFGDSWEHQVVLEKVLEWDEAMTYPVCIKGKRACPPEDCGGLWGYSSFVEIIQDPANPEHEEMLEWVGGEFDPEAFDLAAANVELQERMEERIRYSES